MTAPLVLLIAVTTSPDASRMAGDAAACLRALPAAAPVVVQVTAAAPSEAEARGQAAEAGAAAVVVVTWQDAGRLMTEVRMTAVWLKETAVDPTVRTMTFGPQDQPAERGRALGLVIASFLEEPGRAEETPAAPHRSEPGPGGASAEEAADGEVPVVLAAAEPTRAAPLRWALEAEAITAVDRNQDFDDTLGGTIGLRRVLGPSWAARVGIGFRETDLDGANAGTRTTFLALGAAWNVGGPMRPERLAWGARADLLGVREIVKRDGGDTDGPEIHGLWTVGADLLGQVGYGLSRATAVAVGLGGEGFLSAVSVPEPGRGAFGVPRLRAIAELGILSSF